MGCPPDFCGAKPHEISLDPETWNEIDDIRIIMSLNDGKEKVVIDSIVNDDAKDVHTEHCCGEHKSCKYGEEDCPVVIGSKRASYPCNCNE